MKVYKQKSDEKNYNIKDFIDDLIYITKFYIDIIKWITGYERNYVILYKITFRRDIIYSNFEIEDIVSYTDYKMIKTEKYAKLIAYCITRFKGISINRKLKRKLNFNTMTDLRLFINLLYNNKGNIKTEVFRKWITY